MIHDALNICWTSPDNGIPVPRTALGIRESVQLWKKSMPELVWNTLAGFENNPSTLPQTETILQGYSVNGLRIDEMLQVKRFADACRELGSMVLNGTFNLSQETACLLHGILAEDEALEWGVLRKGSVGIRLVDYTPPSGDDLPALAERGFTALKSIQNPCERAFITFLWMARTQLFYDCNKRTALLMMNGCLLSEGFLPFAFLKGDIEAFNNHLRAFYNSGDATGMLAYIHETCLKIYVF